MAGKQIMGADILDLVWKDGQGLADNAALVDVLDFIYGDTLYERIEEALDAATSEARVKLFEHLKNGEAELNRPSLWKNLNRIEAEKFREWARTNYKPFSKINSLWHPIVQKECRRINEEAEAKGKREDSLLKRQMR